MAFNSQEIKKNFAIKSKLMKMYIRPLLEAALQQVKHNAVAQLQLHHKLVNLSKELLINAMKLNQENHSATMPLTDY